MNASPLSIHRRPPGGPKYPFVVVKEVAGDNKYSVMRRVSEAMLHKGLHPDRIHDFQNELLATKGAPFATLDRWVVFERVREVKE